MLNLIKKKNVTEI